MPSLAHVLQSTDLQAWSCNKAARLLGSSVPTMWVYPDGSSSPQCHGSAVTLFPPQGNPTILSCSSPYESPEESEGMAVRVALQRLLQNPPPPMRVCFIIDNDQIQSKLAHSIRLSSSKDPPPPPRGVLHLDLGSPEPAERPALVHPSQLRLDQRPLWLSGQRGQRLLQQVGSARVPVAQKPNPPPSSGVYHVKQAPNPSRPFCSQNQTSSSQT